MRAAFSLSGATRHGAIALAEGLLVAGIIAALLLALSPIYAPARLISGTEQTYAAKGGNTNATGGGKTTSSLALVLLDSTDGLAHYGQRVTFKVSTTATDRPFVGLRCWQGTGFVYDGYVGFFPTYIGDPWLTLGGMYWDPAVEASCTARLFYYDSRGNQKVLTTTTFAAYP